MLFIERQLLTGSCLKYVRGWCKETENTQENQVGSKEEAENRQVYMGFS